MIDENAFGLLIAYFSLEDDEYTLEVGEFVARLAGFRTQVLDYLKQHRLGDGVLALDLGHAVYFELAEGDEEADPFIWLRSLRARLDEAHYLTVAALVHGGRWVPAEGLELDLPGVEVVGEQVVARVAHSSEVLRKALYVDAAAQEDDSRPGWGPGYYVDPDAIEALGKKLKNKPTALTAAGGTYYRFGK